ncbi:MAG: sulfite exporter TauE/SafE family protein [Terriglobales bacterium]
MEVLVGFLIAATVGLTGMGGGSFTTPALVLMAGMPAAEAVGTAMIFAAVLRVLAAPFYIVRRQIHGKYLGLLLLGAIPGLLIGTWFLHFMYVEAWKSKVLVVVGVLLAVSSAITFLPKVRNPQFAKTRSRWLSLLALPIGLETGISSAGAGALGTMLMLNFSEMPVAQVVGTDILFGIVLAFVGGAFHFLWGSIDGAVLLRLLVGGIPGVLLGCSLASRVSGRKLRMVIASVAIILGLQLVWSGAQSMVRDQSNRSANLLEAKKPLR